MSSLVRRLEKSLMKRAGYTREKWYVGKDPATGEPRIVQVKRGGEITDRDDSPIGRRWPARLPADAMPPKKIRAKIKTPPRGSRRGKRNKAYIARRKALAGEGTGA